MGGLLVSDGAPGLIEPVGWGSRLAPSPDFCYTEVDGVPILVRPADAAVEALTPTWAVLWAQLDGRTLSEALGTGPEMLAPADARNLIEVVRRLKAAELIRDVADTGPSPVHPERQERPPSVVRCTLGGRIVTNQGPTTLMIDQHDAVDLDVELRQTPAGATLTFRRRLRRRRMIDRLVVNVESSDRAVDRFVGMVRALRDRAVLVTPGVVDLFAELAERASAPESPSR